MIRTIWAISILLVMGGQVSAQGALQRTRDSVHPTSGSGSAPAAANSGSSTPSTPSSNDNSDPVPLEDAGTFTVAGVIATGIVVLAPFYGPIHWLDDNFESRMYFAPHPYAGSYTGYQ